MADFVLTAGADTFPGGADNSGDDVIDGLAGADLIHGGGGNDVVFGGIGVDTLFGDDGNDAVDLGTVPTTDSAFGGAGTDTIVLDFASHARKRVVAHFSTGAWIVQVNGNNGPALDGFERMEVNGSDRKDELTGGVLDDVLIGNGGDDRLRGLAGSDTVEDSWGIWDADGGKGNDLLRVANTNAKDLRAGLVFDAIAGTISAGISASGGFSDFERYEVEGTEEADSILTGALDDGVAGLGGGDDISLGGGNDVGDGGSGADRLFGEDGNDTLYAGAPATTTAQDKDRLFGGAGDDLLVVELPALGAAFSYQGAVWDGGDGIDRLEFQPRNAVLDLTQATLTGVETISFVTALTFGLKMNKSQIVSGMNFDLGLGTLTLSNTSGGTVFMYGDLRMAAIQLLDGRGLDIEFSTRTGGGTSASLIGSAGIDTIGGSARDEAIFGNASNDFIQGRDGIDSIDGGDGDDTIFGDNGNDRITGGGGGDLLYGGSGGPINKEIFDYNAVTDSGLAGAIDFIGDFLVAGGGGVDFIDRFDLVNIDAKAGATSNDTFSFIGTVAFSAEGQVRATQSGLDTLIELNIAGTSGAEMSIWLLDFTAINLTQYDFFL